MNTEFDLIQRYFADASRQFSRNEIVLGIGDDGALLDVPNDQLLCVATDVLTADVHFPSQAEPNLIAQRALSVNLSDMAAMGAEPFCFTLGLTIPSVEEKWVEEFSRGLLDLAKRFNCPLVGGDTTYGPLSVAITVQGLANRINRIQRSGAAIGDTIYVTGTLGDGALALPALGIQSHLKDSVALTDQLSADQLEFFSSAYYTPQPRIEFAKSCSAIVTSGIDISDGLVGDLGHITSTSNVGAVIRVDDLPYSSVAKICTTLESRRMAALFGGDDYELCLTVGSSNRTELEQLAKQSGIDLHCIGEITDGDSIKLLDENGLEIEFDHFAYEHFR